MIDSGLARVASHSPWSGLPALQVARISQASANQRAGRAGRTGPGRAIRLYPLEDFVRRPAQDVPQILREDLAPTALLLQAMNMDFRSLHWLDAPPAAAIDHAAGLAAPARCHRQHGPGNGALSTAPALEPPDGGSAPPRRGSRRLRGGRTTQRGRASSGARAARLALGPAGAAGIRVVAVRRAALPAIGRIGRTRREARRRQRRRAAAERPDRLSRSRGAPPSGRGLAVGERRPGAAGAQQHRHRRRPLRGRRSRRPQRSESAAGAPGQRHRARVAARSLPGPLARNLHARMESRRRTRGGGDFADVRPDRDRRRAAPRPIPGRLAFSWRTKQWRPDWRASPISTKSPPSNRACNSRRSTARRPRWMPLPSKPRWHRSPPDSRASPNWNPPRAAAACCAPSNSRCRPVRAACWKRSRPPRIRLPRGRQVPVHYEPNQPPWIASRLQDFFGMRETPTVGRGAVAVVVRLLAPNQRPVQMTSDLAGFWQRLYPQVRKELSRRYPRHAWPENPLA